eukprot:scaffold305_cov110-Cylindrotheca_fusiformis.AAC.16
MENFKNLFRDKHDASHCNERRKDTARWTGGRIQDRVIMVINRFLLHSCDDGTTIATGWSLQTCHAQQQ